ncbi:putative ABC transport system ATP-binding protein [Micromonospora pisi]|uniref:Putative ABC transport system ATP-binding protein n=1 Tax=Micromonospora pisi TaxID=589240 RepID=A0A495JIM6_9ACTN|nr:ABC transporter ATP-binding protein [Micromonospora pisi]RKR88777.1 putative ABC transport system ATP-binding protein [Micromonospora pisi]
MTRSAVHLNRDEPAVEAIDVVRSYDLGAGRVAALRGVSLRIMPGDHLSIVGPSGSGKSTLMHLLGGLDRPTGGELRIGGRDIRTLTAPELADLRNRTIGFVFQSFHLLPRTSAVENVALPLVYRGTGARQRRARAVETLTRVGLGHRLDHRPNQLSGGEQQRVAIARALVTDPAVLLADEPTGNLDSVTGESVLALLEELNTERGVAVVLVTHDRSLAARTRRQVIIRDGLIATDSPVPPRAVAAPEIVDAAPSAEPRFASGSESGHPSGGSGGAAGATGRLRPSHPLPMPRRGGSR